MCCCVVGSSKFWPNVVIFLVLHEAGGCFSLLHTGAAPCATRINSVWIGCGNKESLQMSNPPTIRPDFDTDVLWKPLRFGNRQRTLSTESETSESTSRKASLSDVTPIPMETRTRRLSFTERIFGSPNGGFSWGQAAINENTMKTSVTDDVRLKELLKHQTKMLGDTDGMPAFSRKDYMKA